MKQYIAFFVTELMAACAITSSMWAFTQKDLLEIIIVTAMFAPCLGMVPLLLLDDMEPEEEEPEAMRGPQIYTLTKENYYDRRIG